MKKIDRRKFIQTGIAGLAGLSILKAENAFSGFTNPANVVIDMVKLGETGLMVPLLALGTGSRAGGGSSNQTRLGTQGFVN
jgi:1-deoxyxylulose-5-phosphate synthase